MDREAVVAEIIAALRSIRRPVEDSAVKVIRFPPQGSIEIEKATEQLSLRLASQPEFQIDGGRWISPGDVISSFLPHMAATTLVARAQETDPDEAVSWLERVLATRRAKVRLVMEVRGFSVPAGGRPIGRVHFLPWSELPESRSSKYHSTSYLWNSRDFSVQHPTVAVVVIDDLEVGGARGMSRSIDRVNRVKSLEGTRALVANALLALTGALEDPWSTGRSWCEFVDQDLEAALVGFSWTSDWRDAPHAMGASEIGNDESSFASRYLTFSGKFRRRLDIASARLNLARLRHAIGDKALEASIAFEAMLGDDRFDLSYKLRLRAALLVADDVEARLEVSKTVKDLYQVRSNLVHGSAVETSSGTHLIVGRALGICADVLRRLVKEGREPDWPTLELSAGSKLTAASQTDPP